MPPRLNDLQQYVVEEFVEHYREGTLSRRELIRRVLPVTGGVAATASLLLALGCAPSPAASSTAPTVPTSARSPNQPTAPTTGVASPTTAPATPTTVSASAAPTGVGAATPAGNNTSASATPAPKSKFSVPADDPSITAADVTFPGDGVTLLGYLTQPKGAGPFAAVLVCHENRGLVEHIRDVTRRLAKAGFVGLAVDLLSRDGGTAKVDPAQVAAKLTASLDQPVADFGAAFRYLQTQSMVKSGAIGMIGFCYGGGITWRVATALPDLKAAVPFYGPNPPLTDVPKIKAAILGIYGGDDSRIDAGIPAIEGAMKQNGKVFEKIVYPGANHAFHNDTGPSWNEQAAYDAWGKALDWFKKYLG
jgi:carboxymethylenebutenolidase